MIKVRFFAALRERLDCDETSVDGFRGSANELLEVLKFRSARWRSTFETQQVLCAVNQQLVPLTTMVSEGDEVSLFPPVTGG